MTTWTLLLMGLGAAFFVGAVFGERRAHWALRASATNRTAVLVGETFCYVVPEDEYVALRLAAVKGERSV